MALPGSGPISLGQIQGEFGGSNPISLSEYRPGGAYVASGTSGVWGAIPGSGPISIGHFYGSQFGMVRTIAASGYGDTYSSSAGFSPLYGSIDNRNFDFIPGAQISAIQWTSSVFDNPQRRMVFALVGSHANGGWTSLTIGGLTFSRVHATHVQSSSVTTWYWPYDTATFVMGHSYDIIFR